MAKRGCTETGQVTLKGLAKEGFASKTLQRRLCLAKLSLRNHSVEYL